MSLALGQSPHQGEPFPEKVVRFRLWQRLEHWLLAASFMGLLVTGLPQKFDQTEASLWVVNALGGIDNVRSLHRVLASVFAAESVLYMGEVGLDLFRRRFRPSMVITLQDFRDAFNMLRYSVGLIPERPQFDRYDYRQKFEYWGIVFGAVIMIATGLVLWFPTYATQALPGQLVPAAKEMHSGEALLALLVIVIWHFYDVVLSPSVFPLDTAMVTGFISRERLHEEHPREYMRLVQSRALAAAQAAGQQPRLPPAWGGPAPASLAGVVRRRLHLRVMLLVAIGMAGVVAALTVSAILPVNQSIDRTLDERRALARITALQVDFVVQQGMQTLEGATLSEGFDMGDADPGAEQRALRRALTGSVFSRVYLTDARGQVVGTEPPVDSMSGLDFAAFSPEAKLVLEGGRSSVSGLSSAVSDGAPVVSLVAPVLDSGGAAAGLIAGDISLGGSALIDIVRPGALGSTGYAQIVDSRGNVLASTREGQLLARSDHEGQIASLIEQGRTTSGTCHDCHGPAGREERRTDVMAFAPLDAAPWGVLIRQSEDEALAPARELRERVVMFGVPAFIVVLLLAWVTARSVLRPIGVLTTAAHRIAAGDLSQPVPALGKDEGGGLARAFETMRLRLKQSMEGS